LELVHHHHHHHPLLLLPSRFSFSIFLHRFVIRVSFPRSTRSLLHSLKVRFNSLFFQSLFSQSTDYAAALFCTLGIVLAAYNCVIMIVSFCYLFS
jgi:hypothetical protein